MNLVSKSSHLTEEKQDQILFLYPGQLSLSALGTCIACLPWKLVSFLCPVLIAVLVVASIWWGRNWGKRAIFRPPSLMPLFKDRWVVQPLQGSQQPMVAGCCRCLTWTSFPFLPMDLTQICYKPLDVDLPFLGTWRSASLLLLFQFCSYPLMFLFFQLSLFWEREKERPTRGKKKKKKKVGASVKIPLLSLFYFGIVSRSKQTYICNINLGCSIPVSAGRGLC